MIEYNGLVHYLEYTDEAGRSARVFRTDNFDLLPLCVQKSMSQDLVVAAAKGFRREVTPEFTADVDTHIRDGNLMIIFQEGNVRGFAVRKVVPEAEAVYLAGSVKDPETPSGVVEAVTEKFINDAQLPLVLTRTQNDRVVEMMDQLCQQVITLDKPATNREIEILKRAALLSDKVDSSLIARGHYGGPMILGPRRRSSNPKIRALTDQLDYQNGDALLLVGYRR